MSKIDNEPHAQRNKIESKVGSTQPDSATRSDTSHLIDTNLDIPRVDVLRGGDLDSKIQINIPISHLPAGKGRLKNGNPPGDYSKAARCGAHARRTCKPCQQPAMANGRCRLHGGKSTGPKTPQGLARSSKANWKHGEYSLEGKDELKALRHGLALWMDPNAIFSMSPGELDTLEEVTNRLMNKLKLGIITPFRKAF